MNKRAVRSPLTAERLRELLAYDSETGLFTWKADRSWQVRAGDAAGTPTHKGYVAIKIERRLYRAHRLAWLYVYGVWPSELVDHRDTVKHHNWIDNLRDVDRFVNAQNRHRAGSHSKTGVLGVKVHKGRFQAQISASHDLMYLGSFVTVAEAGQAYLEAKSVVHVGPSANGARAKLAGGAS